ncbi:MAG: signal peptidase I [Bacilli bacterium]|nr:signal peptidase I [Bacilli bacterium]
MKKDKLRLYILEFVLIVVLFFTLFASYIETRWFLATFLLIFMFIIRQLIKKRGIKSIYDKQVLLLMLIFALIYLGVLYALGLHFGFVRSKYLFTIRNIFNIIIPTIIIIISSEVIRVILINQNMVIKIKGHKFDLSLVLIYLSLVLVDYNIYAGIYNLNKLDDFLTAIGFILFSSMANNLLFNYISKRFGAKPIILFRFITILYIYLIPYQPDVYLFLRTFLRILYPFIIYLIFEQTYARSNLAIAYKDKKKSIIWTCFIFGFITLMIMLISCQFKYGIMVIGSESMTGTIDVGDAIIYEQYNKNSKIQKGQVIVFYYGNMSTIHRVVEIKNINGEVRYFTKGDANKSYDSGYRTEADINGLVKLKIKYIGWPTLWLRRLFN